MASTRKTADPAAALRKAVAQYEKASAALAAARSTRNAAMKAMHDGGASYSAIAEVAGCSPMAARSAVLSV